MQGEGKSSTVQQMVKRVQTLKRHVLKEGKVQANIKNFTDAENKNAKVKFTEAGFPIHNYLKEMRDEREREEYKNAQKIKADPAEAKRHAHLSQPAAPRNILQSL